MLRVLTKSVNGTKGYPLNVIISDKSDSDLRNRIGVSNYFRALGFQEGPCSTGAPVGVQKANIGNGVSNADNTIYIFHLEGCDKSNTSSLQITDWVQEDSKGNLGATFISAVVAVPDKEGDKVVTNGYDQGRDQFVARATSNGTGAPVVHPINKSKYTTTVVYNDTQLLADTSASDLKGNIGTDRRVPILQVSRASSSGQTDLSSYRPSIVTMVVAAMVASFPMTYFF